MTDDGMGARGKFSNSDVSNEIGNVRGIFLSRPIRGLGPS